MSSQRKQASEDIEASLDELFEEYQDTIEAVDFRLDLEKVKRDLSKRVNKFLKKKI
jgi:thymidylate kinase